MDIVTYALAKKMMQSAISGISKMTVNGTDLIIETNKGDKVTISFPVPKDGVSVSNITLTDTNDLVFTMSDGETFSAPLNLPDVVEGDSAYEIACQEGFEGTKEEWLESLKGDTPVFKVGKLSNRFFLRTTNSGETETTYFIIPYVTLSETEGGYTLTLTDDKGDHIAFLKHGAQGPEGPQGIQGERGEAFSIAKVYTSVAEMEADFSNEAIKEGQFVLIDTGNVEDEDNAKLYIKGTNGFVFITDLSGTAGIQGPQGIQGIQGPKGDTGPQGPTGPQGDTPEKGVDYWTADDLGNNLTLINGKLTLVTTDEAVEGSSKPITSGGVYAILGNIEALLADI